MTPPPRTAARPSRGIIMVRRGGSAWFHCTRRGDLIKSRGDRCSPLASGARSAVFVSAGGGERCATLTAMVAQTPRAALLQAPKVRAAAVSVAASVAVLALKFLAYMITGSVAVLSDAAESVVNVVAANVALVSLVVVVRPPDATHQYGHGKAEFVSSATEGALIFVGGAWVLVAAAQRLVHPEPLRLLNAGIAVLAVATVANSLTAGYLMRVSHQVLSAALEADARHVQADV